MEYLKYLAADKNPKTGSTPLREYIEVIKFIEEQAADAELARIEKLLKNMKANPVRDRLVEILGGEEALEVFIERLREVPKELQSDMIRGEFERLGSFGPIDEATLRRIIDE